MIDYWTIAALKAKVARLRLLGADRVLSLSVYTLSECYNGTGPEFLPQRIRMKLDAVCKPLLPAVMVHDVDFGLSDGTVGPFRSANRRLLINGIVCACDAHPWYSWRRYVLILEAWTIYRACQKFGWIAWRLAYNKHKQQKGNTNE